MSRTNHTSQIDRMNQVNAINHTNRIDSKDSTSNTDQMNRKVSIGCLDQTNNPNPINSVVRTNNRNSMSNMDRTDSVNPMKSMSNRVSHLSNQELELKLKDLVTKERSLLHIILEHIKEVATRRLYLERAYSSLFEYLVKELGYSGSAAMRRIEAARLLKEVPVVGQKIQEGSLNLSQIGELSRAIKEKEKTSGEKISVLRKENLVAAIAGKSTQETQKELCGALDIQIKEQERQRIQKDDSVRLEVTFSKEQYEKLSQCRDLLAHVLQQNQKDFSWASVMETLADQYLNKKTGTRSPRRTDIDTESTNNIRSETTKAKTKTSSKTAVDIKMIADTEVIVEKEVFARENAITGTKVIADAAAGCGNSHYRASNNRVDRYRGNKDIGRWGEVPRMGVSKSVTPKIKAAVLRRDLFCQFVDPLTKKKCGSTFGLQIDHRTSRWAGGDHTETNLQVLCQWHNRLKYQKESGIHFVSL